MLAAFAWQDSADSLPPVAGAYVVLMVLEGETTLPPRFASARLPAGVYLYFGSAYGPGGIAARCRRHLRPDKGRRWHVDWLTTQAQALVVLPFITGDECSLAAAALAAGSPAPIPGFGSSDCPDCPSHLLGLPIRPPPWPTKTTKPPCQETKGPL
jgi:Uri superfamily endonuclease